MSDITDEQIKEWLQSEDVGKGLMVSPDVYQAMQVYLLKEARKENPSLSHIAVTVNPSLPRGTCKLIVD